MAQGKIRIRLKGYDHQQLDRSAQQIVDTAQRSGATITGPVPLPTDSPVAMDEDLRFAIREGGRTVGSGVVTKILA